MTHADKRRWFQFSLRTLLILTAAAAGPLMAWRAYVAPFRLQRAAMAVIEELGGRYETELGAPNWLAKLFGADKFQNVVSAEITNEDNVLPHRKGESRPGPLALEDRQWRALRHLRFVRTLSFFGVPVRDADLVHFADYRHIENLTLDTTLVSDAGVSLLGSLTSLKRLSLLGTHVTAKAIEHLRVMLPECAFDHATISTEEFEVRDGCGYARMRLTNTGTGALQISHYEGGSPQRWIERRGPDGRQLAGWDWCGTGLTSSTLQPGHSFAWQQGTGNGANDARPLRVGALVRPSAPQEDRRRAIVWSEEISPSPVAAKGGDGRQALRLD